MIFFSQKCVFLGFYFALRLSRFLQDVTHKCIIKIVSSDVTLCWALRCWLRIGSCYENKDTICLSDSLSNKWKCGITQFKVKKTLPRHPLWHKGPVRSKRQKKRSDTNLFQFKSKWHQACVEGGKCAVRCVDSFFFNFVCKGHTIKMHHYYFQ